MWCALFAPLRFETHVVHTISWNDVPLRFECSPKILMISVRRSDKQTLAVFAHAIIILKKIAKDGQSGKLMPFVSRSENRPKPHTVLLTSSL